jgi:aspartate carbamoyltransferase catalytic subunit
MTTELLSRGPARVTPGAVAPVANHRQEINRPPRRHVLDLDDFTPDEIQSVLDTAAGMKAVLSRPIKKVPTLRGKTLITLFYEASTRTRVAFEVAAKALGADTVSVAAATSSVAKGESLIDTIRTLQALGADFVVMRHHQAGAPYVVASEVNASVINAGDGWHAHPTQALLDLFTIRERLGRIDGVRVAIVGDIMHSRVARSNLWGLTLMGAKVTLCGPPTLLPAASFGEDLPWPVDITYNLDEALADADVVMALRMQTERQAGGLFPSVREYVRTYALTEQRMARARPGALVMHPGPMNEGVEIDPAVARSAQSAIEAQVANGVAVRMALLYLMSGLPVEPGLVRA